MNFELKNLDKFPKDGEDFFVFFPNKYFLKNYFPKFIVVGEFWAPKNFYIHQVIETLR